MTSRTCGVLGDPIAHSLSPVLHRAGYAELGLEWTYDAHRVPSGGLGEFLSGLDASWRGLSLTMPLKREALAHLDSLTDRGRLAGAVNTIVFEESADGLRLHGDNTDIPGAVEAIRSHTRASFTSATILGGGATAASTGLALAQMGVTHVDLVVREPARAEETTSVLLQDGVGLTVDVHRLDAAPTGRDIVVSTVPASAQSPELMAAIGEVHTLFDVIYDPWPTPLAAHVAQCGGVVVSGLDLLVHQAAVQFSLFTGQPAPTREMLAAGQRALVERSGGVGH